MIKTSAFLSCLMLRDKAGTHSTRHLNGRSMALEVKQATKRFQSPCGVAYSAGAYFIDTAQALEVVLLKLPLLNRVDMSSTFNSKEPKNVAEQRKLNDEIYVLRAGPIAAYCLHCTNACGKELKLPVKKVMADAPLSRHRD